MAEFFAKWEMHKSLSIAALILLSGASCHEAAGQNTQKTDIWAAPNELEDGAYGYVTANSTMQVLAKFGPRLSVRIGEIAATMAEIPAGNRDPKDLRWLFWGGVRIEPTNSFSEFVAAASTTNIGRLPVGDPSDCRGCSGIRSQPLERVFEAWARTSFKVGKERERLSHLRLAVRVEDGFRVYLNNVMVLERRWPKTSWETAPSSFAGGEAWESITISDPKKSLFEGENTLVVVARPNLQRLAPEIDVRLIGRENVGMMWGPLVQWQADGSTDVLFDSEKLATASVRYGSKPGGSLVTALSANGAAAQFHRVSLGKLSAQNATHYEIVVGKEKVFEGETFGPPSSDEPIRFVVYGDSYLQHAVHSQILNSMLAEAPHFVVLTGDMVLRGHDEGDWQRYFDLARSVTSRVPFFPAMGNHDVVSESQTTRGMADWFGLTRNSYVQGTAAFYYETRVGNVAFLMLDSNAYGQRAQLEWFRASLQKAQDDGVRAIFVAVHDGPYSRGTHGGNETAESLYAPLMRQYHVSMLFSGHDHAYQRGKKDGLRYIVTGGGGSPLYQFRCGVRGTPSCKKSDGWQFGAVEYHYLVVTVTGKRIQVCPKRTDGSALEPCFSFSG